MSGTRVLCSDGKRKLCSDGKRRKVCGGGSAGGGADGCSTGAITAIIGGKNYVFLKVGGSYVGAAGTSLYYDSAALRWKASDGTTTITSDADGWWPTTSVGGGTLTWSGGSSTTVVCDCSCAYLWATSYSVAIPAGSYTNAFGDVFAWSAQTITVMGGCGSWQGVVPNVGEWDSSYYAFAYTYVYAGGGGSGSQNGILRMTWNRGPYGAGVSDRMAIQMQGNDAHFPTVNFVNGSCDPVGSYTASLSPGESVTGGNWVAS